MKSVDFVAGINFLRILTIVMFVLFVGIGLFVLFQAPDRMPAYGQLVSILFPLFMTEVAAALLGKPLKDLANRPAPAKEARGG